MDMQDSGNWAWGQLGPIAVSLRIVVSAAFLEGGSLAIDQYRCSKCWRFVVDSESRLLDNLPGMKLGSNSTRVTNSDGRRGTYGGVRGFARLFTYGSQIREGLRFWRLCMVLAGFSPLFILMAVRGSDAVHDRWLWSFCGIMVSLPVLILVLRLWIVYRNNNPRSIRLGPVEDSRAHVLVYLFATLLPFYRQDLLDYRDLTALSLALAFIVFLFWYLNLHYVNIFLALLGFHVYTVHPGEDHGRYAMRMPIILITRQRFLAAGDEVSAYRLSDTLYWGTSS